MMLAERDDYLHAGVVATCVDFMPAGILAFKIKGLFLTEANIGNKRYSSPKNENPVFIYCLCHAV